MLILEFFCGTKAIFDCDFLKSIANTEVLKNATVFKRLLKIEENELFKIEPFNKKIFIDFKITFSEWSVLLQFFKFKNLRLFDDYYENQRIIRNLIETCNKFGGIPFFDKYLNKLDIDDNIYNPQSPEEDIREIYYWKLIGLDIINDFNDYENWSVTNNIIGCGKSKYCSYIFAKKKKTLGIKKQENSLNNDFIKKQIQSNKIINKEHQSSHDPTFNVSVFD